MFKRHFGKQDDDVPDGGLSLVVAVVGGIVGYSQMKKSQKAQEKAQKAQEAALREKQKQDKLRLARERAQTLREARIKKAELLAQGGNAGISGASAITGGVAGVSSAAASNVSFINSLQQTSTAATNYNIAASGYASDAATASAYSSLGFSAFQGAGGFDTIFDKNNWKVS